MFKRFWWVLLAMFPVGTMVGFLVATLATYMMPKVYQSEATIEVKPSNHRPGNGPGFRTEINPQFFATELEKLQSRRAREKIVDALDLTNRWSVDRESAMGVLMDAVTTQNITGTDLISIRARHANKVDARDIAAEAANAYKEFRTETENRHADRYLQELNKAIRDQEDKVEERRKVLVTIARTKGISPKEADLELHQGADETREAAIQRALDAQDHVDAKRDFKTDQELLQQLKLKQIAETISRKIPGESVIVHEESVISNIPISPNVTLNLVLGAALGFLLSPLMALLVMGILHHKTPAKT